MKRCTFILIAISIIFAFIVAKVNQKSGNELIVEAFNQSEFKASQTNINTYAMLDTTLKDIDSMYNYLKLIDRQIGANDSDEIETEKTDTNITLKKFYKSADAELTIKLETVDNKNSYLILDSTLYNNFDNTIYIKQQMDKVFKNLRLKNRTSIVMTGTYKGDMSYEQKKSIVSDIMKKMNAKFYEDYMTDNIYSVVGYTKKIEEYIYSQKQKLNINLALRYSQLENKTYLYLATPIITVEY